MGHQLSSRYAVVHDDAQIPLRRVIGCAPVSGDMGERHADLGTGPAGDRQPRIPRMRGVPKALGVSQGAGPLRGRCRRGARPSHGAPRLAKGASGSAPGSSGAVPSSTCAR